MSPLVGLATGEHPVVVAAMAEARQVLADAVAEVRTLAEARSGRPAMPGPRRR